MSQLLVEQDLQTRILQARDASLQWLKEVRVEGHPDGVYCSAACHDIERWPGMALPATYNALMCRSLLGALPEERLGVASWILQFRDSTGIFRIPEMNEDEIYKKPDKTETWTYIDFFITNNAVGALEALQVLDHEYPFEAAFLEPYLHPLFLEAWLSRRDLRDPWLEGNLLGYLGSFLLLYSKKDEAVASHLLAILMDWLDRMIEPSTGFWGLGQFISNERLLQSLCGATRLYQLYFALDLDIPFFERAVEFALTVPPEISSAEQDLALVEVLVNSIRQHAYQETLAEEWLLRKLEHLLNFQNTDGGFVDETRGVRHFDGWVHGYSEPQGVSNTYATWLRWLTIALIADTVWPNWYDWKFLHRLGSGYLRRD